MGMVIYVFKDRANYKLFEKEIFVYRFPEKQ